MEKANLWVQPIGPMIVIFIDKITKNLSLLQWVRIKVGYSSRDHITEHVLMAPLLVVKYQQASCDDKGLKALLHFENQCIQEAFNPAALIS